MTHDVDVIRDISSDLGVKPTEEVESVIKKVFEHWLATVVPPMESAERGIVPLWWFFRGYLNGVCLAYTTELRGYSDGRGGYMGITATGAPCEFPSTLHPTKEHLAELHAFMMGYTEDCIDTRWDVLRSWLLYRTVVHAIILKRKVHALRAA